MSENIFKSLSAINVPALLLVVKYETIGAAADTAMGATTKAEVPMVKKTVVRAAAADATKPTDVAIFVMTRALDSLLFVDLTSF